MDVWHYLSRTKVPFGGRYPGLKDEIVTGKFVTTIVRTLIKQNIVCTTAMIALLYGPFTKTHAHDEVLMAVLFPMPLLLLVV